MFLSPHQTKFLKLAQCCPCIFRAHSVHLPKHPELRHAIIGEEVILSVSIYYTSFLFLIAFSCFLFLHPFLFFCFFVLFFPSLPKQLSLYSYVYFKIYYFFFTIPIPITHQHPQPPHTLRPQINIQKPKKQKNHYAPISLVPPTRVFVVVLVFPLRRFLVFLR